MEIEKGQRVVLTTKPAEEDVDVPVGTRGTVKFVFLTGYARVKFDDYGRLLNIPTHCLSPLTAEE